MITDKVHVMVEEWQSRPLKSCYPLLFMNAVFFKVKESGHYGFDKAIESIFPKTVIQSVLSTKSEI